MVRRSPGRWLRGLGRRLRALSLPTLPLVYSRRYSLELPGVPVDPRRVERILAFLQQEGLLRPRQVQRARRIPIRSLRRVHGDDYLERLQDRGGLAALLGFDLADDLHDRFLDTQRSVVGGTLRAARLALGQRGVAVNLGGGLHHAGPDWGQGFCAFNDVAVAVAELRAAGFDERILVIDLDLHDGDGTRAIFAGDPTVHTFSIHNRHLGPIEARASTSIALGDAVSDRRYLAALREHGLSLLDSFDPGLVFYLAGVDPAEDDTLGNWSISPGSLLQRDRLVIERTRARETARPVVVLLGGGYGEQAWRHSARFLAWLLGEGAAVEPPRTAELTLAHYRRIAALLRSTELTAEPNQGAWDLTEVELIPAGRRHRLLDYYSRHGIELALERYGFLDRLRALGFKQVRLEFDPNHPAGQSVKLLTGEQQLLLELRVRRDARTIEGMELLFVEWLLLQNPTLEFTAERPRLPGQIHPGLGLVRETTALLVLACERLRLDGVVFVPAHYHVAVTAARFFRFLDPLRESRFAELRRLLRGMTLADAATSIAAGRVIEHPSGQPFKWDPAPMVLPVSDRLRARFDGEEYRSRVGQPARALRFGLRNDPGPGAG